jgi:maltose alpha-D-glucosyltransferase/alpha-amylase
MAKRPPAETLLEDDPLWYKDAIIYELHVKAFMDSDGDGIGDFAGLTSKLDYLQELGVTALWLLPFYPSPLRDDGYDIADYRAINPSYGTMRDFKMFLREAHARGLRVITELVINHTSDQHAWFQRSRRAKTGSAQRDFYVWSDDPARYGDTRIIFKDFERSNWTWDPVADAYYWHRFYHHQPDLNFDNPAVHKELFQVLDAWLKMGVDGMRLDAIPYLYEREGTNCENLPETHGYLKQLRAHVDARFQNRMLLAEANQWPEDAASYFGEGDECHMNFHFPIMPRLFMSIRMEDRFPIVDILEETPAIPPICQWAMFLRNHDELTLEMVTDEERDYMYRVYAQDAQARINLGIRRRLAPLLHNSRRKIELMNSLLFALPGTPVLYYGDEIGMGDNFYLGDRNGVRTPMQWSGGRNAGFSRANPQRLYLPTIIDPEYHYESLNVEAQQTNPSSLLWWMRRMIALRKSHKAFGRGTLEWVNPENKRVLAFTRSYEGETLLVVANLSRFVQPAEIDLSAHAGSVPIELLGRTRFPKIRETPYILTLGPHGFFWFRLERAAVQRIEVGEPVVIEAPGRSWEAVLRGRARGKLEAEIGRWLRAQRWYAGKGREVRSVAIREVVPLSYDGDEARILFVQVAYVEEEPETYVVPLAFVAGLEAERTERERPGVIVARLAFDGVTGLLVDATARAPFDRALLATVATRREHTGERGSLTGVADTRIGDRDLEPTLGAAEQSNTSIVFEERWVLKLFRRIETGVNLDREIGRALTVAGFPHTPHVAGAIEYRSGRGEPATVAVLQSFVPNQGDTWEHTLDALSRYYERALAEPELPSGEATSDARIGTYLEAARLLGVRTAELHVALGTMDAPAFAPEPFSMLYQRSIYQSMRNLAGHALRLLERRARDLPDPVRAGAEAILGGREAILAVFRSVRERKVDGARIRIHGDYHLGQVLTTGKDFVIIDFEGEPARPLSERRLKRSPLRDVAAMVRSFHYAAYAALFASAERGLGAGELERLEPWARFWHDRVSRAFLEGYDETMRAAVAAGGPRLLPTAPEDRRLLLDVFVLEKALYELRYELENRPEWVRIPIEGVRQRIGDAHA